MFRQPGTDVSCLSLEQRNCLHAEVAYSSRFIMRDAQSKPMRICIEVNTGL